MKITRTEMLVTVALILAIFAPVTSYIIDHIDAPPRPPAMTDLGGCAKYHYVNSVDFVCDVREFPSGDGPEYTAKMVAYRQDMEVWYKTHPESR